MFTGEELVRAKKELTIKREVDYSNALNGNNTFVIGVDKEVIVCGGTDRLVSLQIAYDAQFIDDTNDVLAVKQADGSLVDLSQSECDELLKLMRTKGKEYFGKNEALKAQIDAITEDSVFKDIWGLVW